MRLCYTGQAVGDLRLVNTAGGTGGSAGRLEIFINARWGSVCNDEFSSPDADVACRYLQYDTSTTFGLTLELG